MLRKTKVNQKRKDQTPHTKCFDFSNTSLHQVNKQITLLYINDIMTSSTAALRVVVIIVGEK